MGSWAEKNLGIDKTDSVAFVIAGTSRNEETILADHTIIAEKHLVNRSYILKEKDITFPAVFNVYGAAAMVDLIPLLYDAGVRNLIFIGYAYGGFKDTQVGGLVLPTEAHHFEGIYQHIDNRTISKPDADLRAVTKKVLEQEKLAFEEGKDISVPAVTLQPVHHNKAYLKIDPLTIEMELASCFARAQDLGMRSSGILIISDNRESHISDHENRKDTAATKKQLFDTLVRNITSFDLPPLDTEPFDIDAHLAHIIHDPDDKRNVYRNH